MTRVLIEDAAQRALQAYLQPEFDRYFTGVDRCIVSEEFPPADQGLPKRAVSIIPAGARQDARFQERDIARSDYPDGKTSLYTYRVGCCRQPIQLDVWATAPSSRGEICALLDDFLTRGTAYTLGTYNGDAVRDGVLLALDPADGGFTGFADFTFDGPAFTDTGRSVREREYCASIAGFIDVDLTTQAASARLAHVYIQMALSGTLAPGVPPPSTLKLSLTSATGALAITEH